MGPTTTRKTIAAGDVDAVCTSPGRSPRPTLIRHFAAPRSTQTFLSFESESPRVIPFHTQGAKRPGTPRRRGAPDAPPTRRARVAEAVNLELGLREATSKASEDAAPRSFLYGYARAASPMHRSLAAVLDGSMIVIAAGLFLLTFHLGGGELAFNKGTVL